MDRLTLLRQMVERSPGDPFPLYGLAMELRKEGRLDEADAAFRRLVEDQPGYVAAYLMYGGLLIERQEPERARTILDQGIEAAKAAGDEHACSELEAARGEIP